MTVLERLKLELNKEYLSDNDYIALLLENNLTSTDAYDKATMQRDLLWTCIDVLEMISNDIDSMRRVESDFVSTESAAKYLEQRIAKIKERIYSLSDDEQDSNISLLFSRTYW